MADDKMTKVIKSPAHMANLGKRNRYKKLSRIAHTKQSSVHKCADLETGDEVVVKKTKMIHAVISAGDEVVSTIDDLVVQKTKIGKLLVLPNTCLREFSLWRDLEHQNIVRTHDAFLYGKVHLVMDHLDMSLRKFLDQMFSRKNQLRSDNSSLTPEEQIKFDVAFNTTSEKFNRLKKKFLLQILEGVSYLHSHDILHRDLKPENVLIDVKKEVVKIADFNLARMDGAHYGRYTSQVGTVAYRAPEVLFGYGHTKASDIWAVGCIFYYMVTARQLLRNEQVDAIFDFFRFFGKPNPAIIEMTENSRAIVESMQFPSQPVKFLDIEAASLDSSGLNLLKRMLDIDPRTRITSRDAILDPYFDDVKSYLDPEGERNAYKYSRNYMCLVHDLGMFRVDTVDLLRHAEARELEQRQKFLAEIDGLNRHFKRLRDKNIKVYRRQRFRL